MRLLTLLLTIALLPYHAEAGTVSGPEADAVGLVECANLVYGKNQTSVCFADHFLGQANKDTSIRVTPNFRPVNLDSPALFQYPFCVFSGEGDFTFTTAERENFRKYLTSGGFVVASPACSNPDWDTALRKNLAACFPDVKLQKIPMTHELFSVVYPIPTLTLKSGGTTLIEGLFVDGRLVMIHSSEGLNDSFNAKGCCCCGGNQVKECVQVNINALVYALLY